MIFEQIGTRLKYFLQSVFEKIGIKCKYYGLMRGNVLDDEKQGQQGLGSNSFIS